jgi:endothelin-converting enzyme/putative endopeptidase
MVQAMNYGGIGMVMGHELTHGFDDEGRQFDGDGNLKDWWTPSVGSEFDKRTSCVAQQFDEYVAVEDQHINGKLTLGENIADLGGLKLAYAAFAASKQGKKAASPPGAKFTPEQQFFLGYAQSWCGNYRKEMLRLQVATNPHSPPRFRVVGPISNMSEFAQAFQCKEGSAMVRPAAKRCQVW